MEKTLRRNSLISPASREMISYICLLLCLLAQYLNAAFLSEKWLVSLLPSGPDADCSRSTPADEIMGCSSALKKNNFIFPLDWGWGSKKWSRRGRCGGEVGGCCFFGSKPETSVSVCSDDIIFLLSHRSDTPLSSALVFTDPTLSQVLAWNLALVCGETSF